MKKINTTLAKMKTLVLSFVLHCWIIFSYSPYGHFSPKIAAETLVYYCLTPDPIKVASTISPFGKECIRYTVQ